MIPSPWEFAILALGAFRLTRLLGWDTFPPIVRLRARLLRERGDVGGVVWWERELLADLVNCPFCLGFWVSLACYGAWLLTEKWTLVALLPFALSGVVGLVAKNLDE
jgi:hypothetical protein